jgi:hypothetical protein
MGLGSRNIGLPGQGRGQKVHSYFIKGHAAAYTGKPHLNDKTFNYLSKACQKAYEAGWEKGLLDREENKQTENARVLKCEDGRTIEFEFDAKKELKSRKDSWGRSLWDVALLNPNLTDDDLKRWPTEYRVRVCDVPGIEQYMSSVWKLYLNPEVKYYSMSDEWDNRQITDTEKAIDDWSDEEWIEWAKQALCDHIVYDAIGSGR